MNYLNENIKTVKVLDSLTFDRFGCEAKYFEFYIKGKPLKLVDELQSIALVEDSAGEQFTIKKSLLLADNS